MSTLHGQNGKPQIEINEYDHVRIKSNGIAGIVVDVPRTTHHRWYIVESDERGVPGGYGPEGEYKLFDCLLEDLEKI